MTIPGTPEPMTDLEPSIAQGLEDWILAFMKERQYQKHKKVTIYQGGRRLPPDLSFQIAEVVAEMYHVAPNAVAEMLKAGGASFCQPDEPEPDHAEV